MIKQEIIGLMTTVPPAIQNQIGDAISVIAQSDFYERWETLVDVRNHQYDCYRTDRFVGTRLSPDRRQRHSQYRYPASSALDIQTLATSVSYRWALRGNQLRPL